MNNIKFKVIILFFSFFFFISTAFLFLAKVEPILVFRYFSAQVGSAIGVSMNVPPNPFSDLAEQLKEKELSLAEKEETIGSKEEELTNKFLPKDTGVLFLFLGAGIFLLVLLNFYFDWKKRKCQPCR